MFENADKIELTFKTKVFRYFRNLSHRRRKIHFAYFTCEKHFEYLLLSLKSLEKLIGIGKVFINLDKRDNFSEDQKQRIQSLNLDITISKTKYKMSWAGVKVIDNEITAFKEISEKIKSDDFICKIDSDVIFISDEIIKKVIESDELFIGNEMNYLKGINYFQGGCYFIHKSIIPKLNYDGKSINDTLKKLNEIRGANKYGLLDESPEDAAIYDLIIKITSEIESINFFQTNFDEGHILSLNDDEMNFKEYFKEYCNKYSLIHFENDKDRMSEFLDKLN